MHPSSLSRTRRIARRALLAGTVMLTLAAPLRAQEQNAGGPGEWLSRYSTARTLGLGGAFVAMADDPLGVLWNPAGLSGMNQNAIHFETARIFGETNVNGISFAVPGSWLPSLGVSVVSLSSGD